jgi:hypothetical protein
MLGAFDVEPALHPAHLLFHPSYLWFNLNHMLLYPTARVKL